MQEIEPLVATSPKYAKEVRVLRPWDGKSIAKAYKLDFTELDKVLEIASQLFADRKRWLPLSERLEIINRVCLLMEECQESLTYQAAEEGGKPLVDSRIEVQRAIETLRSCIYHFHNPSSHGDCIPMGLTPASENRLAVTIHEPIGPVLAFSAFNHPLNLIAHQIGPAIAAGCPVIIKPAEATPLSGFSLVHVFHECGLPVEYCQAILCADRETSVRLVSDPRVGFFSFIGSGNVGWMLKKQLADGTRCSLEHGGCAPVIIGEDADLDSILPLLAKGAFYHAGQVCVSVQRIYVPKAQAASVAKRLGKLASAMKIGNPVNASTEVGPLITPSNVQRVGEWVTEACAAGGELICGGKPHKKGSAYTCTVLLDPPDDAKVSVREVFGPVACVYSYSDPEDAVRRANALPFSFQASVITSNIDEAMHLAKNLNAAAVMINDHTAFRVDWMPFAGYMHSGYGTGGVPYTIEDMSCKKMLVIRSPSL